jgi:hypothetical protein
MHIVSNYQHCNIKLATLRFTLDNFGGNGKIGGFGAELALNRAGRATAGGADLL